MNTFKLYSCLLLAALTNSSCIQHSKPNHLRAHSNDAKAMVAFVDQDGTFYPDDYPNESKGWPIPKNKPKFVTGAYSLKVLRWQKLNSQKPVRNRGEMDPETAQALKSIGKGIPERFAKVLKNKKRVFILVHGYNNTEMEAIEPYEMIRKRLDLKPSDGLLYFHWDGLSAKSKIRSVSIWNNAAPYSQLAGQFGLRKILNLLHKKDIYLISHSCGAAVILSALSEPFYQEQFENPTLGKGSSRRSGINRFPGLKSLSEAPGLKENKNNYHVILMAPAIGLDLFQKSNEDESLKTFSGQLKSLRYTVNLRDNVLDKPLVGPRFLNSTEMGCRKDFITHLKPHYPFTIQAYDVTGFKGHDFQSYVADLSFQKMLSEAQAEARQ